VTPSEAKFKINIKEGIIEIEGSDMFVERHLEKFEEICKTAIQEIVARRIDDAKKTKGKNILGNNPQQHDIIPISTRHTEKIAGKHMNRQYTPLPPIPVDLKANQNKIGLREFYDQKKPLSHYEKTAVFVYYLTKFNHKPEVKFGEILSCYDEVDERKPSIFDIIKNSIRYKGWLAQGSDKFATVLTISGENFVGYDLPQNKDHVPSILNQTQNR
jgi:hypothetical protein